MSVVVPRLRVSLCAILLELTVVSIAAQPLPSMSLSNLPQLHFPNLDSVVQRLASMPPLPEPSAMTGTGTPNQQTGLSQLHQLSPGDGSDRANAIQTQFQYGQIIGVGRPLAASYSAPQWQPIQLATNLQFAPPTQTQLPQFQFPTPPTNPSGGNAALPPNSLSNFPWSSSAPAATAASLPSESLTTTIQQLPLPDLSRFPSLITGANTAMSIVNAIDTPLTAMAAQTANAASAAASSSLLSSLPPYPYASDFASISAALARYLNSSIQPSLQDFAQFTSSMTDSDLLTVQQMLGINVNKIADVSVTNAPFAPAVQCHPIDFACQTYSACFVCYSNRMNPMCPQCLRVHQCQNLPNATPLTTLQCYIQSICNMCNNAIHEDMCTILQHRCANGQ